jgi:acetoin utilization deacetylase AcuC-like enzyme
MKTGLVYDDRFLLHRAPFFHPEHPGRIQAIWEHLGSQGLIAPCERVAAREATDEEILMVHSEELLRTVDATAGRELTQLDPDTYAGADSARAARLAAGALVDLTLAVATGRLENGLALLRPPGHHAETSQAMGFCLFNNVAVAARAARAAGARRILIVDWDVHHGNGTQNTFWDDRDILYFSIHQFPFYPGTGNLHDVGSARAAGANVNVPWPAGMRDADYLAAFDRILLPIADAFDPDLVLVSCGFDAARGDLLGEMQVTPEGFAAMTERLTRFAGGKVVLALEGGYELGIIARSAAACLGVLLGERAAEDDLGSPGAQARHVLDEVARVQKKYWKL